MRKLNSVCFNFKLRGKENKGSELRKIGLIVRNRMKKERSKFKKIGTEIQVRERKKSFKSSEK